MKKLEAIVHPLVAAQRDVFLRQVRTPDYLIPFFWNHRRVELCVNAKFNQLSAAANAIHSENAPPVHYTYAMYMPGRECA